MSPTINRLKELSLIWRLKAEAFAGKKALHCLKCDSWYEAEPGKLYEAGVLCPECRTRRYAMVGVCHLEDLPGYDQERAEELEALADCAELLGDMHGHNARLDAVTDLIFKKWLTAEPAVSGTGG